MHDSGILSYNNVSSESSIILANSNDYHHMAQSYLKPNGNISYQLFFHNEFLDSMNSSILWSLPFP
jgi:hypothetical protein